MQIIKNFLFLLPFSCFLAGYYIPKYLFYSSEIVVPNIVGRTLNDSLKILSEVRLDMRLLKFVESNVIADGFVISQIPDSGRTLKENQHVFVTVSKKPESILIPNFLGQRKEEVSKWFGKQGFNYKIYWLNSDLSRGSCITSNPSVGNILNTTPIFYFSSGRKNLRLIPNLKSKNFSVVQSFLRDNKVEFETFHAYDIDQNHDCKNCIVSEQWPQEGSVVDFNKKVFMQLSLKGFC